MKKLAFILCLILLPTGAGSIDIDGIAIDGIGLETSGEANATMGITTAGTSEQSTSYLTRCSKATATSTFTATYGYFYGETGDASAGTFEIGVYGDNAGYPDWDGGQVGSCSEEGNIPVNGSKAWNEVTFAVGLSIVDSTTYWLCVHANEGVDMWYASDSNNAAYESSGTCGLSEAVEGLSSYKISIFVANYDAH